MGKVKAQVQARSQNLAARPLFFPPKITIQSNSQSTSQMCKIYV